VKTRCQTCVNEVLTGSYCSEITRSYEDCLCCCCCCCFVVIGLAALGVFVVSVPMSEANDIKRDSLERRER